MEITKVEDHNVLTLSLKGRLDTITSPEFEKELDEVKEEPYITELHLDLKDLVYTSSAGLRAILDAQKLMNGRNGMSIYNVNDEILEVLDITGLLGVLTVA